MRYRHVMYSILLAVGIAAGFWLGSSPASPVNPNPPRPVLRAFAGLIRTAARLGLWIAIAGEQQPVETSRGRQQLATRPTRYDADGHPIVDHAEGW
jgi:formate-dependent nitrite reductase membrane component NrfD